MDALHLDRPVAIRLHSSIQHPGQAKETHEIQTTGSYIEKAGIAYLKFVEQQNDDAIQTTVKMGNEQALIMRSGPLNMRLPFLKDAERPGAYKNAQANLKLRVRTKHLESINETTSTEGRFSVHYELYTADSLLGKYELSITYSEGIK